MDAQKAQKVLAALTALYPEARAELHFSNPTKRWWPPSSRPSAPTGVSIR